MVSASCSTKRPTTWKSPRDSIIKLKKCKVILKRCDIISIKPCSVVLERCQVELAQRIRKATAYSFFSTVKTSSVYKNLFAINALKQIEDPPELPENHISCKGCNYIDTTLHDEVFCKEDADNDRKKQCNDNAVRILESHGILPANTTQMYCPKPLCNGHPMSLIQINKDTWIWKCFKRNLVKKYPKSKAHLEQCCHSISKQSGTFLTKNHIAPSKLLIFINLWLKRSYNQREAALQANISATTCLRLKQKCEIACETYVSNNFKMIGGPGIYVELDETIISKTVLNKGNRFYWIFGGIQRHGFAYRSFLIPLVVSTFNQSLNRRELRILHRDSKTLIPMITKHVRPGSIIITDGWKAYLKLSKPIGGVVYYEHHVINHNKHYVDPRNPHIHTNNIERYWQWMKQYCKRPGNRLRYLKRYIAKFLVLTAPKLRGASQYQRTKEFNVWEKRKLHHFLCILGKVYKHPYA